MRCKRGLDHSQTLRTQGSIAGAATHFMDITLQWALAPRDSDTRAVRGGRWVFQHVLQSSGASEGPDSKSCQRGVTVPRDRDDPFRVF